MLRKARVILIGLLCVLVLSAAAAASERTKVEVWDWWAGEAIYDPWWDFIKTTFEERNPDLELVVLHVPNIYNLAERLILGAAGGVLPDVAQSSIVTGRELYELGVLLELNPLIERTQGTEIANFIPATQYYNHKGDTVYGISLNMAANALIYNVDHFEESGLDADPLALRSWGDWRDAVRKLAHVDPNGSVQRGGIQRLAANINNFGPFLHANGGDFYNADQTAHVFASDQGIEALEMMVDLFGRMNVAGGNFRQGTASMWVGGNWDGLSIAEANPEMRFELTTLPAGPSGRERATQTWSNMLVIPRNAPNPEASWRYIQFVTSVEVNEKLVEVLGRLPARLDYYASGHWAQASADAPYLANAPTIAMAGGVYPFLSNPAVRQATDALFAAAYAGEAAPATALRQAEEQANVELSRE